MKCNVVIILALAAIVNSCRMIVPEPIEPNKPVEYVSTDWGVNDYLPLAVGNTWTYNYTYTRTTEERYQPRVTTTTTLGYEKWEVKSVSKISDSSEAFSISIFRKDGADSTLYVKEIVRTSTKFRDVYFDDIYVPRTGTDLEYGGNPYYKKGVGMTKRTWGGFSGGPGTSASWLYSLSLSSYKIKS